MNPIKESELLRPITTSTTNGQALALKEFYQKRYGFWISTSFHLHHNAEEPAQAPSARPYAASLLKSDAHDRDIIPELPEQHLSTLGDIAGFLAAQPNKKKGFLLTNRAYCNNMNICYVSGRDGQVFAVSFYWRPSIFRWVITSHELNKGWWWQGSYVLYPIT